MPVSARIRSPAALFSADHRTVILIHRKALRGRILRCSSYDATEASPRNDSRRRLSGGGGDGIIVSSLKRSNERKAELAESLESLFTKIGTRGRDQKPMLRTSSQIAAKTG